MNQKPFDVWSAPPLFQYFLFGLISLNVVWERHSQRLNPHPETVGTLACGVREPVVLFSFCQIPMIKPYWKRRGDKSFLCSFFKKYIYIYMFDLNVIKLLTKYGKCLLSFYCIWLLMFENTGLKKKKDFSNFHWLQGGTISAECLVDKQTYKLNWLQREWPIQWGKTKD